MMKYYKQSRHNLNQDSSPKQHFPPLKILDKLTRIFGGNADRQAGIPSQNQPLEYYQVEEPVEVLNTQPRLKVQSSQDVIPWLNADDTEIQNTKVAKHQLEKGHPPCKWFLKVVSGTEQGRQYIATTPEVKIGRKTENHICLRDPKVSRYHALIRLEGMCVVLVDLGSTNGTSVNDERISDEMRLHSGDQFKVGDTIIQIFSEVW